MKQVYFLLFIILLLLAIPAAAQEIEWDINFFDDYDDNSFSWPLGAETQGTADINRVIKDISHATSATAIPA